MVIWLEFYYTSCFVDVHRFVKRCGSRFNHFTVFASALAVSELLTIHIFYVEKCGHGQEEQHSQWLY